jgi:hypothetical protein
MNVSSVFGRELLATAECVTVEPSWASRTWSGRRYPQQCYSKTVKYVLDHSEIVGMRLVQGVACSAFHSARSCMGGIAR